MKAFRRIAALCTLLSAGLVMLMSRAAGGDTSRSKLRLMLRHSGLVTAGTVLAVAMLIAGGLYLAERPTQLRAAYDSSDSEDEQFMQLLSKQLATDHARIRLRLAPQAGATTAADAIDRGVTDIALVRHDLAAAKKGLAIAIVRHNVLLLMAPAKGSIAAGGAKARRGKPVDSFDDIAGKRLGLVGKPDDYTNLLSAIFKQYGIPSDKVKLVPLDAANLTDSLRRTPVDVLAVLGPIAAPGLAAVVDAATHGDDAPKFLTLDGAEAFAERHLEFESSEVKAGAFEGTPLRPDDTVEVVGYADLIVAAPTLSDSTASELTRRILNARHAFDTALPHSVKVQAPDASKDTDLPVHPGTAAYINDNRETFLDRYGDFIYLGLMLVSGIGSALAWLISYARANVHQQRSSKVGHVLHMARTAKTATSTEQLDKLSAEVDEILVRVIHRAGHDDDSEESLQPIAMAIEHLRHTISERRAVLMKEPPAQVRPYIRPAAPPERAS